MTDTWQLPDVYGSVAEVPLLLEAAASSADSDSPAWHELWQRLYNQGTVAPASYAALPQLAQIARARRDVALATEPALLLFAAIIGSTDGPPEIADIRDRHSSAIAALVPVAEHKLDLAGDRTEIIYALQTIAALEDISVWQHLLESLAHDEVELECPACGDDVYLELVGDHLVATADPDEPEEGRAVRPARPVDLAEPETRLLDVCHVHGHATVAVELLHLFGEVTCPSCETLFRVADAFA